MAVGPDSAGAATTIENATAIVTQLVRPITDREWLLELAALAAANPPRAAVLRNSLVNAALQLAAGALALAMHLLLLLRFGGSSPSRVSASLHAAPLVIALHGEDTTRTRHLRASLARYLEDVEVPPPVLLLGRPSSSPRAAAAALDPGSCLVAAAMIRPLSLGSFLAALPRALGLLARGSGATASYAAPLPFRERVAISYRMVQGATHAAWWRRAVGTRAEGKAVLGHTGTADVTGLELAMQASGFTTVHAVHGASNGWAFAGLSDVALFTSGADARLGASLPGYGRCIHLPQDPPPVSPGNGDWTVLTSYTHLHQPGFAVHGSRPDCELVGWVRAAADAVGLDPARVFWRPHPQIDLVPAVERERLETAVAEAGFRRWPTDLPYSALGGFSVAITTPSTVLVDALRLGQPAIVAKLAPLQGDVLYTAHPLLVADQGALLNAIAQVSDHRGRAELFARAWRAIEPGGRLDIAGLLKLL